MPKKWYKNYYCPICLVQLRSKKSSNITWIIILCHLEPAIILILIETYGKQLWYLDMLFIISLLLPMSLFLLMFYRDKYEL